MFDFLYQLISVSTGTINKTVKAMTGGLLAAVFSVWGALTSCLGLGLFAITKLNSMVTTVLAKLTTAFDLYTSSTGGGYGFSGVSASVLQLCNTFFPLTETLSFGLVLLSMHVAFLAYRFVKSWIPTLS